METHRCAECRKGYKTASELSSHKCSHKNSSVSFKCTVCSKVFKSASALSIHKHCHMEDPSFKCKVCGEACSSPWALHRHKKAEHEKNAKSRKGVYRCNYCGKQYSDPSTLFRHKFDKHSGHTHTCEHCQKSFAGSRHLNKHKQIVHQSYRYKCPWCTSKFCTRKTLARHKFKHKYPDGYKCDKCGEILTSRQMLTDHMKHTHHEDWNHCNGCGELFPSKSKFFKHVRRCVNYKPDALQKVEDTDTEDSKLICPICQKYCRSKDELICHLKTHAQSDFIKDENGGHSCVVCPNYRTLHKARINTHVKTVHFEDGVLCPICGICLKNHSLNAHMKTHSDQFGHLCPVCGMKFVHNNDYSKHMQTHGIIYRCTVCRKTFSTPDGLDCHIERMHTAFACTTCYICGVQFLQKYDFKAHMFKHTGKGFLCLVCFETFAEQGYLDNHQAKSHMQCESCLLWFMDEHCLKLHLEFEQNACRGRTRPFKCSQCEKAYIAKKYLNMHMRRLHGETFVSVNMEEGRQLLKKALKRVRQSAVTKEINKSTDMQMTTEKNKRASVRMTKEKNKMTNMQITKEKNKTASKQNTKEKSMASMQITKEKNKRTNMRKSEQLKFGKVKERKEKNMTQVLRKLQRKDEKQKVGEFQDNKKKRKVEKVTLKNEKHKLKNSKEENKKKSMSKANCAEPNSHSFVEMEQIEVTESFSEHEVDHEVFKCHLCRKVFLSKYYLDIHVEILHPESFASIVIAQEKDHI